MLNPLPPFIPSVESLEDRRALCGDNRVTLNGQPARVVGAMLTYASVYIRDENDRAAGQSYEFPWERVARAIALGEDLRT